MWVFGECLFCFTIFSTGGIHCQSHAIQRTKLPWKMPRKLRALSPRGQNLALETAGRRGQAQRFPANPIDPGTRVSPRRPRSGGLFTVPTGLPAASFHLGLQSLGHLGKRRRDRFLGRCGEASAPGVERWCGSGLERLPHTPSARGRACDLAAAFLGV